ncbi:hypothetical protein SHI21_06240 [Bacteriovorax sp. PP10]|uniref:Branched-chain amino acid ABC transporter permease n=1 Tax=Bacteriovorax antarcticus TaxID=3088717 RepID=A0ABU5VRW3_9BACT|nr:hypothetical protein [Bacteriovorax sp. PP10]MEA9355789.1 hypothetical protein [Bacteriovorax sp. PP10]
MKNYIEAFSLVTLVTIYMGTIVYLFMQKSVLLQGLSYSIAATIS